MSTKASELLNVDPGLSLFAHSRVQSASRGPSFGGNAGNSVPVVLDCVLSERIIPDVVLGVCENEVGVRVFALVFFGVLSVM